MLRKLRLRQKKRFSYKKLCIDMSLKVKKVSHGIFQALYQYVKANNKYMKDFLQLMFNILKIHIAFTIVHPFLSEKNENSKR